MMKRIIITLSLVTPCVFQPTYPITIENRVEELEKHVSELSATVINLSHRSESISQQLAGEIDMMAKKITQLKKKTGIVDWELYESPY